MAGAQYTGSIDPATDKIIIGGLILSKAGLAEDDSVTLERDEMVSSTYNGINNRYGNAIIQNTRGTLTVRLQETAIENQALWAILGTTIGGVINRVPWVIQRGNVDDGGYQVAGGLCWLEQQPSVSFGASISEREWVFKVDDASFNLAAATNALL